MKKRFLPFLLFSIILAACSNQATPDPAEVAKLAEQAVHATLTAQAAQTPNPTLIAQIAQEAVQATLTARAVEAVQATLTAVAAQAPNATQIAEAVQATLTAQAALTPAATDTPLPTSTPVPTDAPTPAPTDTPTPAPTDTPTPLPQPEAVVTSKSLNVRAGPSTTHPVVTVVRHGDELLVIGRNKNGSWLEVQLPSNKSGWVASNLVDLNDYGQEIQVSEVIPTPPPAPKKPTPPPAATEPAPASRTLEVSFLNPHYECQQREWGSDPPTWGYRSFQVDMYIKNNGTEPVEPPWQPTRWIITDGQNDYVNDVQWQWVSRSTGFYDQPTIYPGQSAGWTFLAFPIDRNQWLKAVEYEYKGQLYRQEFDLGPYKNNDNYQDCGDPAPHTVRPTPTPRS